MLRHARPTQLKLGVNERGPRRGTYGNFLVAVLAGRGGPFTYCPIANWQYHLGSRNPVRPHGEKIIGFGTVFAGAFIDKIMTSGVLWNDALINIRTTPVSGILGPLHQFKQTIAALRVVVIVHLE